MSASRRAIRVKRIYDDVTSDDGQRVLVDRLWPRGISKERAALDLWCKEIAPSTPLRQWYDHTPDRFPEFAQRYRDELAEPERAALLEQLRDLARHATVTLLTATRDPSISAADVLAMVLRHHDGH